MTKVSRAVASSLTDAPVSIREISRRSHVSHAQLARIVAGERPATDAVAKSVLKALDEMTTEIARSADGVRRVLKEEKR